MRGAADAARSAEVERGGGLKSPKFSEGQAISVMSVAGGIAECSSPLLQEFSSPGPGRREETDHSDGTPTTPMENRTPTTPMEKRLALMVAGQV